MKSVKIQARSAESTLADTQVAPGADTPAVFPTSSGSVGRHSQSEVLYHSRSGPLCSPEELRQYKEVMPGLEVQLVAMTEKEQAHRHDLQKALIFSQIGAVQRGQYFALIIALAGFAAALYCASNGYERLAGVFVSVPLVAIVAHFLRSAYDNLKEVKSESTEEAKQQDTKQKRRNRKS